ncbi:AraC-like DNA-binding protein [Spirosoma lacussanchae]|uniref:helix-turn-helix domain-containing protein n=1 Tax=Spirosoma lacussanchae TaxID=1884249 RepID=UPI00110A074B|nr:AraC family transcriptional regulator [Spirosoma lacussanchae]
MQTLYIKNMVCDRCVWIVKRELEQLGLTPVCVHIGEVVLAEPLESTRLDAIKGALNPYGLSLLEDTKLQLVERIKAAIVELVHQEDVSTPLKFSDYLSEKIQQSYPYLSTLFSTIENTTIEHFIILQRIERIKELLIYNELSIEEIAYRLGYSSGQYLANQFKKYTGLTPTQFRQNNEARRRPLDQVLMP